MKFYSQFPILFSEFGEVGFNFPLVGYTAQHLWISWKSGHKRLFLGVVWGENIKEVAFTRVSWKRITFLSEEPRWISLYPLMRSIIFAVLLILSPKCMKCFLYSKTKMSHYIGILNDDIVINGITVVRWLHEYEWPMYISVCILN